MTISVLIVDDHILSRKAIASILSANPLFMIAGEATTGKEALEKAKDLTPDLILMDIRMPEGDGLEATRLIKAALPAIKIIILSVSDDVQDFFEAIKLGAQGYLLKNMEPEYWLDYIVSIVEKEVLQLISQGLGNKEIGEKLFISESTVKNHLRNILDKLHLQNRMQLIAFAYKNGLAG
ncbi:MAG: vraR 1 [Anaerospora sp.]|nr:vraR 1 [Anaerospora sp.]